MTKTALYFVTCLIIFCSCHQKTATVQLPYHTGDTSAMLFNGWKLSPAGKTVHLGYLPLNITISHNGKLLAVTNNGQGPQSLELVDLQTEKVTDSIPIKASWLGLKFSDDDNYLYASGGNKNSILRYNVTGGHLKYDTTIHLGKPWPKEKISVTGIDLDEKHNNIFAVTREDSSLYICDLKTLKVKQKIKMGSECYTVLYKEKNGRRLLYISLWGAGEIAVVDVERNTITDKISVGTHPNDMTLSHDGKWLYVANANSNTVSVIDISSNTVVETIGTTLYPTQLPGSTTNGVALSDDDKMLFVANADNNYLAVLSVEQPGHSKPLGFIPTGWYPTSVKVLGNKIYVCNGKGNYSLPDPRGPNPNLSDTTAKKRQYIGHLFNGTLSIIDMPTPGQLVTYSRQVVNNTPYKSDNDTAKGVEANNPIPVKTGDASPIKYVFYIIKENRTYDQVFGDLKEGNGDSSLCLFPQKVTPNDHKLVQQYVLLDNFYANAEVSADGHNWSMGAYATDYVQKVWPTSYSGRGGNYDYEGDRKIVEPDKGYIWNYCQRAGISYRTYGEFVALGVTHQPELVGHAPANVPGFDLKVMDTTRERLWEHDFDSLLAANAVPHFQSIRLGNDHTSGSKPGAPTPLAAVADNDLALGLLVQHLSHSKIWSQCVVFVLEDDAQDGPDHVDAHRTTAYVIGPFVKRNTVIHTLYTTTGMLRTIELILGLPPMSQYDAAATPLYDCFTANTDTTGYTVVPNNIDLQLRNPAKGKLAQLSANIDLSQEDRVPDLLFSEIIWKAVKGENSILPAPKHSVFLMEALSPKDKDDD